MHAGNLFLGPIGGTATPARSFLSPSLLLPHLSPAGASAGSFFGILAGVRSLAKQRRRRLGESTPCRAGPYSQNEGLCFGRGGKAAGIPGTLCLGVLLSWVWAAATRLALRWVVGCGLAGWLGRVHLSAKRFLRSRRDFRVRWKLLFFSRTASDPASDGSLGAAIFSLLRDS